MLAGFQGNTFPLRVQGIVTSGDCTQFVDQRTVKDSGSTCGGGTAVTSVTGTANQVTVTGTTAVTLSTPSTFIAPGSSAATTGLTSGTNGGVAGSLTLNGSTSGAFTHTASATGATETISGSLLAPISCSSIAYSFTGDANTGFCDNSVGVAIFKSSNNNIFSVESTGSFWYDTRVVGFKSSGFANDSGLSRVTAGVLGFGTGGSASVAGFYQWGGQRRVTSQFDKTSDTTLAVVTGLTVSVAAGRTYSFRAVLHENQLAAGGGKYSIGGTATATSIIFSCTNANITSGAVIPASTGTRGTSIGATVCDAGTGTGNSTTIDGLITVNAAGTLAPQFAQNVSNGTASSILVGSTFTVFDTP